MLWLLYASEYLPPKHDWIKLILAVLLNRSHIPSDKKSAVCGEFAVKAKWERNRKIEKEALKQAVARKPDVFFKEYAEQFNCTPSAVYYAFVSLNITRKKVFMYYEKSD